MRTRSEKVKRKIAGNIKIYTLYIYFIHFDIISSWVSKKWCEFFFVFVLWNITFVQFEQAYQYTVVFFFNMNLFFLEGFFFWRDKFDDWYFFFLKLFWHYIFFFKSIFFHTSQQNIELETSRLWALFREFILPTSYYFQSSHIWSAFIQRWFCKFIAIFRGLKNSHRNRHHTFTQQFSQLFCFSNFFFINKWRL